MLPKCWILIVKTTEKGEEGKGRKEILFFHSPRSQENHWFKKKKNWDWDRKVLVFIEILWSANKPDIKSWPLLWKKKIKEQNITSRVLKTISFWNPWALSRCPFMLFVTSLVCGCVPESCPLGARLSPINCF